MAGVVAGERPGFGEEVTEPVYLVCTNGRHDRCCATYGRPALALQASHGDLTWESSHGGDRFAGNLACLRRPLLRPGRARDAERVVALHRRGPSTSTTTAAAAGPDGRPGGRVVRPPLHRPDRRRRSRPARPRPAGDRPGGGPVPAVPAAASCGSCSVPPGPPTPACSPVAAPGRSHHRASRCWSWPPSPGPGGSAASSATLGWTVRPSRWRVRSSQGQERQRGVDDDVDDGDGRVDGDRVAAADSSTAPRPLRSSSA